MSTYMAPIRRPAPASRASAAGARAEPAGKAARRKISRPASARGRPRSSCSTAFCHLHCSGFRSRGRRIPPSRKLTGSRLTPGVERDRRPRFRRRANGSARLGREAGRPRSRRAVSRCRAPRAASTSRVSDRVCRTCAFTPDRRRPATRGASVRARSATGQCAQPLVSYERRFLGAGQLCPCLMANGRSLVGSASTDACQSRIRAIFTMSP